MSYLNNFCDPFLMHDFAVANDELIKTEDPLNIESLLRDYAGNRDEIDHYFAGAFEITCKNLCKIGCYSYILKYMYAVFMHYDRYDLSRIFNVLSKIKVDENIMLSDLCAEYYLDIRRKEISLMEDSDEDGALFDVDLYHDDLSKTDIIEKLMSSPKMMTEYMPEFLGKKIYGVNIDVSDITQKDVDNFAAAAIARKFRVYEKIQRKLEDDNRRIDATNEKLGGKAHISKMVQPAMTEFDSNLLIPGALLDLFSICEITNKEDICRYILNKYVLKVFSDVPWDQESALIRLYGVLFNTYSDYLYSLELTHNSYLSMSWNDYGYSKEEYIREITGTKEKILKRGKDIYKDFPDEGIYLSKIMMGGKTFLKKYIPEERYSFLIALASYILCCTGKYEEASDFLIREYFYRQ